MGLFKILAGVAIGVTAVAAAPFTGGGSLLAGAAAMGLGTGAAVAGAVAAGAVGAVAGGVLSDMEKEEKERQQRIAEQEEIERRTREEQEKFAAKEREYIVTYANNRLISLYKKYRETNFHTTVSLNYPKLKESIKSSGSPRKILNRLGQKIPINKEITAANSEIKHLQVEIDEIQQLIKTINDIHKENMKA